MYTKKFLSVILSLIFVMSFITVSATNTDLQTVIEDKLSIHRDSSTAEQELELLNIEAQYNIIKAYDKSLSPWSDISSSLITAEIVNKQSFRRTCELEYLRDKTVTLSGSPSPALLAKLSTFNADNAAINVDYNFSGYTVEAAAAKYGALENALSQVHSKLLNIEQDASNESISLLVNSAPYTGPIAPVIDDMIATKITNLMKSIGSVVFSTKSTWQNALDELFSDDNIKLIGSMFGADFALAISNTATTQAIFNYLSGDEILNKMVSGNFSDLFTAHADIANIALTNMMIEIMNGLMDLPEMANAKVGFLDSGWTVANFSNALKIICDAADPNVYSRLINLNMVFGRYLTVYKNNNIAALPLLIDSLYASNTFDLKIKKNSINVGITNLIKTIVYDDEDATEQSTKIVSANDQAELKFTLSANSDGTYHMVVYRSGDLNTIDIGSFESIYGYIGKVQINVASNYRPVTAVSIKQGKEITIFTGRTLSLEANVIPSKATNKGVTWSTSDSSIVTVSSDGTIRGVRIGTAIITVKTEDGEFTSTIKVNVRRTTPDAGNATVPTYPPASGDKTGVFKDVPTSHWASEQIEALYKKGVIKGVTAESFEPDKPLTRAELAIIVTGIMDVAPVENGIVFEDTINHYAKNYISAAARYSLMIGYDEKTFAPDVYVPREQVVMVILRAIHFKGEMINSGEFVTLSGPEVLERIINILGYDPRGTITKYTDLDTATSWAKGYVEVAIATGLLKGYDDNTIRPTVNATRAEAAVMTGRTLIK